MTAIEHLGVQNACIYPNWQIRFDITVHISLAKTLVLCLAFCCGETGYIYIFFRRKIKLNSRSAELWHSLRLSRNNCNTRSYKTRASTLTLWVAVDGGIPETGWDWSRYLGSGHPDGGEYTILYTACEVRRRPSLHKDLANRSIVTYSTTAGRYQRCSCVGSFRASFQRHRPRNWDVHVTLVVSPGLQVSVINREWGVNLTVSLKFSSLRVQGICIMSIEKHHVSREGFRTGYICLFR